MQAELHNAKAKDGLRAGVSNGPWGIESAMESRADLPFATKPPRRDEYRLR
jgi:hypothetical protein